ncbi:MAG: hypothetical protein WCG80_02135 [Spirochaetales bacterium]
MYLKAETSKPIPEVLLRFTFYLKQVLGSQPITRTSVTSFDEARHPEGFSYIDTRQFQYDMQFLDVLLGQLLTKDGRLVRRKNGAEYVYIASPLSSDPKDEEAPMVDPIYPFLAQLAEQTTALPPQTGSWMLELLTRWTRETKNPLEGKIVYHEVRTRPREREWDFEVGGLDTPDQAELGLIDTLLRALAQGDPVYLTVSRSKPRLFLPYLLVNSADGWHLVGDEVTGVPGTASEVCNTRVYPWGLLESAQLPTTESGRLRAVWRFERKDAYELQKDYVEIYGSLMGDRVHEVDLLLTGNAARWALSHVLYPGQPVVEATRSSDGIIRARLRLRVRDLREAVQFCFQWPGEVSHDSPELAAGLEEQLGQWQVAFGKVTGKS